MGEHIARVLAYRDLAQAWEELRVSLASEDVDVRARAAADARATWRGLATGQLGSGDSASRWLSLAELLARIAGRPAEANKLAAMVAGLSSRDRDKSRQAAAKYWRRLERVSVRRGALLKLVDRIERGFRLLAAQELRAARACGESIGVGVVPLDLPARSTAPGPAKERRQ